MDPATLTALGLASGLAGTGVSLYEAFKGQPEYMDPTSEAFRRRQQALATQIAGPQTGSAFRGAEQATFGALGGSEAIGQQQAQLAAALRAQAEGRGLSLAQLQYQQALGASQAAAQSQLASARGLTPAQAQRLMLTQQAGQRAGMAAQSAQLRAQEQLAAQGALGNLLGQQRQQELLGGQLAAGLYGTAGGLGTQQAISQAQLTQRSKEEAMGLGERQQERETKAASAGAGALGTLGSALLQRAHGGNAIVPGKAKFNGDTRSNDTVPAMLSPGEIVLPRSVAQSEDAPDKAKKFVEAIKKQKRPSPKAWAEALAQLKELQARVDAMEALADLEAEEEG